MDSKENKSIAGNEIDLISLVKLLWGGRRKVIKITIFFIILGVVVALIIPEEYTSGCRLIPEVQYGESGSFGGLSSLAGLAGFDVDNGSGVSVLTPDLYPAIAKSLTFQMELLNEKVYYREYDTLITGFDYFQHFRTKSILAYVSEYTIGLPYTVKKWFISNDVDTGGPSEYVDPSIVRLSKEKFQIIENFRERIIVEADEITGLISISIDMPHPQTAAIYAHLLKENLTERATEYKLEKLQDNLKFLQAQHDEKKAEYREKQLALANFVDKNQNIRSSVYQTNYQNLRNEVNAAFELYRGMVIQLEQVKATVAEETPVFTVLEPIQIPIEKSRPRRGLTVVIFAFLGGVLGCAIVLGKEILKEFKASN